MWLSWVGGAAGVFILVSMGIWLVTRYRIRRGAARARYLLGPAQEHLPDPTTVQVVTLEGTLRCDGACTQFDRGAPAAAVTMWGASLKDDPPDRGPLIIFDRAPGLSLVVDETPVSLEGPVAVHVGSDEWHPGRNFNKLDKEIFHRIIEANDGPPLFHLDRQFSFRSIKPGDRVQVRGKVNRRVTPQDDDHYRAPAGSWSLTPHLADPADGGIGLDVLEMSFEGTSRLRGPSRGVAARRATLGLAPLALIFALLGAYRWFSEPGPAFVAAGPHRYHERLFKDRWPQKSQMNHKFLIRSFNKVLNACRSNGAVQLAVCRKRTTDDLRQQEQSTGLRMTLMTYCLLLDSDDTRARSLAGDRLHRVSQASYPEMASAANASLYSCLQSRLVYAERFVRPGRSRIVTNVDAVRISLQSNHIEGLARSLTMIGVALGRQKDVLDVLLKHTDPAATKAGMHAMFSTRLQAFFHLRGLIGRRDDPPLRRVILASFASQKRRLSVEDRSKLCREMTRAMQDRDLQGTMPHLTGIIQFCQMHRDRMVDEARAQLGKNSFNRTLTYLVGRLYRTAPLTLQRKILALLIDALHPDVVLTHETRRTALEVIFACDRLEGMKLVQRNLSRDPSPDVQTSTLGGGQRWSAELRDRGAVLLARARQRLQRRQRYTVENKLRVAAHRVLNSCGESRRFRGPANLYVTVEGRGRVTDIKIKNAAARVLRTCVTGKLGKLRFPRFSGPPITGYTYRLFSFHPDRMLVRSH